MNVFNNKSLTLNMINAKNYYRSQKLETIADFLDLVYNRFDKWIILDYDEIYNNWKVIIRDLDDMSLSFMSYEDCPEDAYLNAIDRVLWEFGSPIKKRFMIKKTTITLLLINIT